MLTKKELKKWQRESAQLLEKAGIVITSAEKDRLEVVDFGLGQYEQTGLGIIVYVNTQRYCAKELAMLPRQTCPEHRHPPVGRTNSGKEETFRCRWGKVYLYVPGVKPVKIRARLPKGREKYHTVWHEVVLKPGDQYTLKPNTLHWFQAGRKGAVVSEFSTRSLDEKDVFTDPQITRITKVIESGKVSATIADGSVTEAKPAADTVTTAKIADGRVATGDPADGAVAKQ